MSHHDRFRRVSRLRRGYHRRQVDAFLNHVEVSLGGVFPPPTAAEVRQAGFELVHGGYAVEEVDEFLDELEERVLVRQGALPVAGAGWTRTARPSSSRAS